MVLKKISERIHRRRLFYAATRAEHELREHYAARNREVAEPAETPLLAIQGMRLDPYYYSLFGEIVQALRAKMPIRVEQCDLYGLRAHAMISIGAYIRSWLVYNPVAARFWERHYGAFCDGLAYRSFGLLNPISELRIWFQAMSIWRGLKSSDQLASLQIRGITMGDLIIDSYLRFRPSPTVDIDHPYMFVVIRQALKDLARAFDYFERKRPSLYVTSYLSYVQHGTAARVAASLGVPVFSLLANRQRFSKPVTAADNAPSEQGAHYRRDFAALPDQVGKLAIGRDALQARISGKRDMTNADMKTSQYEIKTTDVPDVRGAIIVFLHDFYDAPHEGEWMLYQDFWEWICATIEILQNAGLPFYLKSHPTQRSDSDTEVSRIKRLYPDCRFLSPDIANTQLVEGGMACAVTVHGSVAAEMAFMGIPTIAAGDNGYVSFNFCRTARTKDEYKQSLENYRQIRMDKNEMREEASAFQYMYLFNLDEADLRLRDAALTLRSAVHNDITAGRALSERAIVDGMQSLVHQPGFGRFIDQLAAILRRTQQTRFLRAAAQPVFATNNANASSDRNTSGSKIKAGVQR